MIRILFGGDICPMGTIESAFIDGKAPDIFNDLLDEITISDLSIANLECPLISERSPISKAGEVLGSSIECINGFSAANWHVLNLANNHSYDHGDRGLLETINAIRRAGLTPLGAGMNIKEASTPLITEINGKRIVVFSMAEREFSVAGDATAGSNPLDLINFVKAVRQHKENGYFITLIHGGLQYYSYPSPEMIRRCHFMVDMGADAVICCHAHCPQPWEFYSGRPIIYGLGNLIFESIGEPEIWYMGYLARLNFEEENVQLDVVPYFQSKEKPGAHKMSREAGEKFLKEMELKNILVKDESFIKDQWDMCTRKRRYAYLESLFGHNNRIVRKIREFFAGKLHSKRDVLQALHFVQCETHREVLNTIFEQEKRKK